MILTTRRQKRNSSDTIFGAYWGDDLGTVMDSAIGVSPIHSSFSRLYECTIILEVLDGTIRSSPHSSTIIYLTASPLPPKNRKCTR